MKVTIKQIAELANVSRGTVDRILHNRPGVNEETKERVKRILKELDYEPNVAAKALAYQKKPMTIGVIISEDFKPYTDSIKQGVYAAEKELKDFGLKIEYASMTKFDFHEQVRIIDQFIEKGVAGIMLRPINAPIIVEKIDEAVDKGIPVVTYNSDINGSKRMCFIGPDLYKSGKVAAELLGKIMNESGKVAIITGSYQVNAHNQRISGFMDFMKRNYPEIEVIKIIETLEDPTITFNSMIELLKTVEDMKGIYVTAGSIKQIGQVIQSMNKNKIIKFGGFDLYPEVVELIKEGIMDFTIGQDLFSQGYQPIKILFNYLFLNQKPDKEMFFTKLDIRVECNID